jgi:hypothetical protein
MGDDLRPSTRRGFGPGKMKGNMNPTNNKIETNLKHLLRKHGLTVKSRKVSGVCSDHVTVNECGAEFVVGAQEVTVRHPEGGWMDVSSFTTTEILAL